jgi:hypothetical protein
LARSVPLARQIVPMKCNKSLVVKYWCVPLFSMSSVLKKAKVTFSERKLLSQPKNIPDATLPKDQQHKRTFLTETKRYLQPAQILHRSCNKVTMIFENKTHLMAIQASTRNQPNQIKSEIYNKQGNNHIKNFLSVALSGDKRDLKEILDEKLNKMILDINPNIRT